MDVKIKKCANAHKIEVVMKINKKIVVILALLLLVMSDSMALDRPHSVRVIRAAQKHAARTTIIPARKTIQYGRASLGGRVQGRMLATRGIQLKNTSKGTRKNTAHNQNKAVQESIAQTNDTFVKDTEQKVSAPTPQATVEKVEQQIDVVNKNEQKKNQSPKASEIKSVNNLQKQSHIQAPVQCAPVEQKTNITQKLPGTVQINSTQPMPLTENASINQQEKSDIINAQQNNSEQLIEMPDSQEKFKEFMEDLHKLPSAQRLAIIDKLAMPDEQKEQFKQIVAQMPSAVDEVTKDLQDPNSQAGKALQGKGWLEWFRQDILDYSWVKTASYYGRKVWDNTGGKLLTTIFGYEPKEETDFLFEGGQWFLEGILERFGLKTPGQMLDETLQYALKSCFPKENSWPNMIAKISLAIGYYGGIRGNSSTLISWKVAEAFICTSYCKYFTKENAGWMRYSIIDFFAYYIPNGIKNGWIEYFVNFAIEPYKKLLTLSTMGAELASIAKANMNSPQVAI